MKIVAFIFGMLLLIQQETMSSMAKEFHHIDNAIKLNNFLSKYSKGNCRECRPYLAAATMRKAEYVTMPFSKIKYFNQGKSMLENYISAYPNDLEARYLRIIVQNNIPSFLGYNDNIRSDKQFVLNNIQKSTIPSDYQKIILQQLSKIQ